MFIKNGTRYCVMHNHKRTGYKSPGQQPHIPVAPRCPPPLDPQLKGWVCSCYKADFTEPLLPEKAMQKPLGPYHPNAQRNKLMVALQANSVQC